MRGDCIYMQIAVQMYLKGWDSRTLAEKSGISYNNFRRKMRGAVQLTLNESKRIQKALNCGLTLDDLFAERKREG